MQREHDVEKAPLLDGAQVVAPIGIDVTELKLLSSPSPGWWPAWGW